MRETSAEQKQQNRAESILEYQTEVEVEFRIEEEKAADAPAIWLELFWLELTTTR